MRLIILLITILTQQCQISVTDFIKECHNKEGLNDDMFTWVKRLTNNSKYISMPDAYKFTAEKYGEWCERRDMQMARINTIVDYKSINDYLIHGRTDCQDTFLWLIAGSDEEEEGVWKYKDGSNMTFAAFYALEPTDSAQDADEHANYLGLACAYRPTLEGTKLAFLYRDLQFEVKEKVEFFCEYKEDTPCWKNSFETKANKYLIDGFATLKDPAIYKLAAQQKTWHQAKAFCQENKMELLDLEFEDVVVAQRAYEALLKIQKQMDFMSLGTSFILSGSFSKFFAGDSVPFEWEWIDQGWRDKNDVTNWFFYGYLGQMKYGKCLSVTVLYKTSDDVPKFTLSMAHCNVPHWTVCVSKDGQV